MLQRVLKGRIVFTPLIDSSGQLGTVSSSRRYNEDHSA